MAENIRRKDWSETALGPLEEWSDDLRRAVATVLEVGFPAVLFWGKELTAIHNDAYRPLLGNKSDILGRTLPEIWQEVMDILRPAVDLAFKGKASTFRRSPFVLERSGFPEQAWFDWSFSPVRDSNGEVTGILNICIETTEQVLADRRQSFLLSLSDVLRNEDEPERILSAVMRMLGELLEVDRVGYAEVLRNREQFIIRGQWHTGRVSALPAVCPTQAFGEKLIESLHNGKIYGIEDLEACSKVTGDDFTTAINSLKARAVVNCPFVTSGSLSTLLFVHHASPRHWRDDEIDLIKETATRTWSACQRRRTEQALARSEEHFRNLADAMPQLVWTANPDGSVDYYNSRIQAFAGFQVNEQGLWEWEPILHPEDREPAAAAWRAACETGEPYQIEHRVRVFDGSYRWFLSRAIPYRKQGEVVKWYGTATDIDDMKKGGDVLRHTEAQLSAIIAHAPVGIYLVDADLCLREINPRAAPMFAKVNEPLGAPIGEVLRALWPQDAAESITGHFQETLRTGKSHLDPVFTAKRLRGGERAYFHWEIHRVTLPDGQFGLVCYFIDISGHVHSHQKIQESEARFRTMADGLPLIVWVHDAEGKQEFVNETFCQFFGVTREKMKKDEWQILMHPDDAGAYTSEFFQCIKNQSNFHGEVRVRNGRGEWRKIESWGRPRFSSTGRYLGIVGTSADITERARTEAAIRESEHQLRKLSETLEYRVAERTAELQEKTNRLRNLANELASTEHRERKRLAALLHDDLQQLLVAAKMQTRVVNRHVVGEDGKRALEQADRWIGEATEAARDLTRQLRPPILYEGGLLPAVHWLASEMEERHGLTIEIDAEGLVQSLSDDIKSLLFECIRELLFNVAKYASVKTASVKLREKDDNLQVFVVDEGRGFEIDSVAKDRQQDGFGLFSIRERIAALAGSMSIESSPGRGTRIELTVPIQEGGVLDKDFHTFRSTKPMKDRRSAISTDLRTRVLIVDDHTMVRQGIANIINGDERLLVVGEAADGVEAIEAVEKCAPDVVLMDLNMPRMNGIDATREIRRVWPGILVLGLSVQNDDATASSMLDAGAARFLSKAGDTEEIISTILSLANGNFEDQPVQ